MEKLMDSNRKDKIQRYIKNRLDISELIEGYSIKGMNLSRAIIKKLNKSDCDISGVSFTRAKIGVEGGIVYFNNTKARNCNFKQTNFLGKVMARRFDARNSNFMGAIMPYMDYRYADLRGCNFCDAVFSLGTAKAYGALFDDKFFKDLGEFWGIEITVKRMEDKHYDFGRLKERIREERRIQRES